MASGNFLHLESETKSDIQMKFTAHNITLRDGSTTMPQNQVLANSRQWLSVKETILFFQRTEILSRDRPLSVVDLGCLEGGYTVELARMGFNALGIEIREESIEKCQYVKDNLCLDNLRFAQDDVRNLRQYGTFDIVFCYGLFYHLDNPAAYLKEMYDSCNGVLILDTHYAPERDWRYAFGFLNRLFYSRLERRIGLSSRFNYGLSGISNHEGYRGRWYTEWHRSTSQLKINRLFRASHGNRLSFWLCKSDLLKAIKAAGFRHVYEQGNFTGDVIREDYVEYHDRSIFICIK